MTRQRRLARANADSHADMEWEPPTPAEHARRARAAKKRWICGVDCRSAYLCSPPRHSLMWRADRQQRPMGSMRTQVHLAQLDSRVAAGIFHRRLHRVDADLAPHLVGETEIVSRHPSEPEPEHKSARDPSGPSTVAECRGRLAVLDKAGHGRRAQCAGLVYQPVRDSHGRGREVCVDVWPDIDSPVGIQWQPNQSHSGILATRKRRTYFTRELKLKEGACLRVDRRRPYVGRGQRVEYRQMRGYCTTSRC